MNDVLSVKKLFVFDMDGTIYLGGRTFPFAVDFINRLRGAGRKVLFFTNNASHSKRFYIEKLTRMGFSPREGEILSSGHVTIEFLKRRRAGKTVFLLGTDDLKREFAESGVPLRGIIERKDSKATGMYDTDADIVVSSFDTTLEYAGVSALCRAVMRGAEYLCTHPDFNCPTEDGFIPDSGAIAAMVTASTGVTPTFFGKPEPATLDVITEVTGVEKRDICVFGDRLYTDIAFGTKNGVTSVLVMTGETTEAMLKNAKPEETPAFVYPSLSEADRDIAL